MSEENLYYTRVAIVETKMQHLKEEQDKNFKELERLIHDVRAAYQADKTLSATQRWQMKLAFYVAGLGFIANAIVTIVRDLIGK
jgi:hypothetical protein